MALPGHVSTVFIRSLILRAPLRPYDGRLFNLGQLNRGFAAFNGDQAYACLVPPSSRECQLSASSNRL